MNYYGIELVTVYYGKILSAGYAGTLYAYDAKTGKLLWTYNATSLGHESPYGENYPLSIGAVCDGKVYCTRLSTRLLSPSGAVHTSAAST